MHISALIFVPSYRDSDRDHFYCHIVILCPCGISNTNPGQKYETYINTIKRGDLFSSIYLPSISLKMSSSRIMFFFTVLLIFISTAKLDGDGNGNGGGYGDGVGISTPSTCTKCSICPYPCRSQPASPSGYHSYGAPPPPSPVAQVNCPPDAPVQCCQQQYAPPTPFYYPYNNYSGSPHFQVIKPYTSWWIFGLVTLFRVHQV